MILAFVMIAQGCAGNKGKNDRAEMLKNMVTTSLYEGFELKHDQTALITPESLYVRFINVVEDSRCPVGVNCIWAGQAVIELVVSFEGEEPELITLTSQAGKDDLAVKQLEGYLFRLVKVEPPKKKDAEIELEDYKVTLTVSPIKENTGQSSQ